MFFKSLIQKEIDAESALTHDARNKRQKGARLRQA